ncbi:RfbP [Desulforapulum autotrophicum HRM2]|uniref:RfbP n=1 Tax=Desulforapulum autotrophicum (strain ATCC 43914 / DSM 3382 / VKM B-1955 / HRM2) TaxID=177437 RepID=C0QGZ1_DESAH|nr:sugar transferase [Desulforapulum autotrophicum]ACN15640.1 RfbP [Desulforapulum autotrophicum HRM2]
MLREHSSLTLDLQKTLDISITGFSFIAAYFIKRHLLPGSLSGLSIGPNYYIILLLIIISWHISFKWMGMYLSYRNKSFWEFFFIILKSCFLGMVLLTTGLYLMHIQGVSRLLLVLFMVLCISGLTLSKFIVYRTLRKIRSQGYNTRNLLIVGSKARAIDIIRAVESHQDSGYLILGCFDVDGELVGKTVINGHKVIGSIGGLEAFLVNNVVDELIFAMPLKEIMYADKYLAIAENLGVKVRIIPDWQVNFLMYRPGVARIAFEDFLGIYTMSLQTTPQNEGKLFVKILLDYLGGVVFLILSLPLFAVIASAIKLISKGPVFYTQERLGLNGRTFEVYKFRTMVNNADELRKELQDYNEADGPAFKIKKDPRVIPWVGTFLRKTSLDELPQLFNVLRGEMSIVGPRPPIPAEVEEYSMWQRRRLSMKPGLTCLWQIAPSRNDLTFDQWMKMDLEYIDNWSLFLDFKLLVLTFKAVLTGAGR